MTATGPASAGRRRFGSRRVGAACTTCPTPVRIHIHLDANRDGKVDERWWLNGSWTAGRGRLGAVVLCNCDDEDRAVDAEGKPTGDADEDHKNKIVDTAEDSSDIAPFYLRRHPERARVPAKWKVVVEVLGGRESLFRIFHKDRAGGRQLLGPKTADGETNVASFELTDLSPKEWKYGMEVNQFPGRVKDPDNEDRGVRPEGESWDGHVDVKLSLIDGEGVVRDSEQAKIRCAPWVIFNHADPTEEVYVVHEPAGYNERFIADLNAASGMPARQFEDRDVWMQDIMEVGFSTLPRRAPSPDMHLPAALRTKNRRDDRGTAAAQVKTTLLTKNYGYYQALTPQAEFKSLDSFGNLECVPPFRHPGTGKDYQFGRIVFGVSGGQDNMAEEVTEFLRAQKVQFPFTIDTGWLVVGHVDEVLSFLPTPDSALGFKAVCACPRKALEIARGLPGDTPVFRGVSDFDTDYGSFIVSGKYWRQTVTDLLDESQTPNIVSASLYAQAQIDKIKEVLRNEVGLPPADFIDLPILFAMERGKAIAYTAGSANMLVVTSGPQTREGARSVRLVIPKPFGPTVAAAGATGSAAPACVFETEIARVLSLPGVSFAFVDDFVDYHALSGEIHCGTNSKRKGAIDRFWWEQEGI